MKSEVGFRSFLPVRVLKLHPRELRDEITCAVIFTDLSGFSALAEQLITQEQERLHDGKGDLWSRRESASAGAEALSEHLNDYFSRLLSVLQSYGCDVLKFAGDAVLAMMEMDLTESALDLGLRAGRCGLAILNAMQSTPYNVHVSVGIGTANFLHLGGVSDKWEYTLVGDAVSDAVMGVDVAKAGELALPLPTWHLIKPAFPDAVLHTLRASGKDQQGNAAGGGKEYAILKHSVGSEGGASGWLSRYLTSNKRSTAASGMRRSPSVSEVARGQVPSPVHAQADESLEWVQGVEQADELKRYLDGALLSCLALGSFMAENRSPTVMFVTLPELDMKGIAAAARSRCGSPTGLEGELDLCVQAIQRHVAQYAGFLRQFIVDDKGAVAIAAWGVLTHTHENDAQRAVLAALDIREAIAVITPKACGVGVATGRTFCGVVGNEWRCEYALISKTVNLASRLSCLGSTVVCDQTTARLAAAPPLSMRPHGTATLKGFSHPVEVFRPARALTNKSSKALTSLRPSPLTSPFTSPRPPSVVGRADELQLVRRFIHNMQMYDCGGVLVIEGPPGIGKSFLVQRAMEAASNVHVLRGSGSCMEQRTPYFALRSIYRSIFAHQIKSSFDPAVISSRVGEQLDHMWAGLSCLSPLLDVVLGIALPPNDFCSSMTDDERSHNTSRLLEAILRYVFGWPVPDDLKLATAPAHDKSLRGAACSSSRDVTRKLFCTAHHNSKPAPLNQHTAATAPNTSMSTRHLSNPTHAAAPSLPCTTNRSSLRTLGLGSRKSSADSQGGDVLGGLGASGSISAALTRNSSIIRFLNVNKASLSEVAEETDSLSPSPSHPNLHSHPPHTTPHHPATLAFPTPPLTPNPPVLPVPLPGAVDTDRPCVRFDDTAATPPVGTLSSSMASASTTSKSRRPSLARRLSHNLSMMLSALTSPKSFKRVPCTSPPHPETRPATPPSPHTWAAQASLSSHQSVSKRVSFLPTSSSVLPHTPPTITPPPTQRSPASVPLPLALSAAPPSRLQATSQAVCLLIEDAHCMDMPSWRLLFTLSNNTPNFKAIVALRPIAPRRNQYYEAIARKARDGNDDAQVGKENAHGAASHVVLQGLDAAASSLLVSNALGLADNTLPQWLCDALWSKTRGNPFFLRETARILAESALVVSGNGASGVRLSANAWTPQAIPIPDSVERIVMANLESLSPEESLLCKVAAVIGMEGTFAMLRDVFPIDVDNDVFYNLVQAALRTGVLVGIAPDDLPDPAHNMHRRGSAASDAFVFGSEASTVTNSVRVLVPPPPLYVDLASTPSALISLNSSGHTTPMPAMPRPASLRRVRLPTCISSLNAHEVREGRRCGSDKDKDSSRFSGFRFTHAITRDVAYSMLSSASRCSLHEACARYIEDNNRAVDRTCRRLAMRPAGSRPLMPASGRGRSSVQHLSAVFNLLAYHWAEARNPSAHMIYLELAAHLALCAGAPHDCLDLLHQALENRLADDGSAQRLQLMAAHAHLRLGDVVAARTVLETCGLATKQVSPWHTLACATRAIVCWMVSHPRLFFGKHASKAAALGGGDKLNNLSSGSKGRGRRGKQWLRDGTRHEMRVAEEAVEHRRCEALLLLTQLDLLASVDVVPLAYTAFRSMWITRPRAGAGGLWEACWPKVHAMLGLALCSVHATRVGDKLLRAAYMAVASRPHHPSRVFTTLLCAVAALHRPDFISCAQLADEGASLVSESEQATAAVQFMVLKGAAAYLSGDFQAALNVFPARCPVLQGMPASHFLAAAAVHGRSLVLLATGRADEVLSLLGDVDGSLGASQDTWSRFATAALLAHALAARSMDYAATLSDASRLLRQALTSCHGRPYLANALQWDVVRLHVATIANVLAHINLASGRPDPTADTAWVKLEAVRALGALEVAAAWAPAAQPLYHVAASIVAATVGSIKSAKRHLKVAAAYAQQFGMPYIRAIALRGLGDLASSEAVSCVHHAAAAAAFPDIAHTLPTAPQPNVYLV